MTSLDRYIEICEKMSESHGAEQGQMFGKKCLKMNGKAYVAFFQDEMVFKLSGERHAHALELTGSKLWDPSGKGRPMKEWVQVPAAHAHLWGELAEGSVRYEINKT